MAGWTCSTCHGENQEGTRFCGHCGVAPAPVQPPSRAGTTAEEASAAMLRSFVARQVADPLVEAGGTLPEERRLVTALFADVSGFTALADRLDPEELLEVIDPVISVLSSVVGRYEGYVEKFAGDALMALFGAPVSHEDDANRALAAALEMHAELARVRADLGPDAAQLTLHVGVNSGHGIARILGSEARKDYAVLGDSVILAQRLESAAPPGETYVSELTYRMTLGEYEFESVGELTLKGKVDPVPAYRLLGRRSQRDSARYASRAPLVGRADELARMESLLNGLAQGTGAVIAVLGEPGVGKSRLTEEVRRRAGELGIHWLDARCLSYGADLPYWPYAELLRAVFNADDRAASTFDKIGAAGVDAETASYFARLLGSPVPAESDAELLEPQAFRRNLHHAFARWLAQLAAERPLVLALEDVHWADSSSLDLTVELAGLCEGPLALHLVARREGAAAIDLVAASAGAAEHRFELEPLADEEVHGLVAGMLGGEPPLELLGVIEGRTGGNPFFAGEVVRALLDAGDLGQSDGSWVMRPGWTSEAVPETVETLLAARIDALPRPDADVLQTAAVVGRRSRVELLRALVGNPLDESLERLVAGGLLDRLDDGDNAVVGFHHALVQDVSYGRLLRRRRRELHRAVAETAERLYGAGDDIVELLAFHLYLGDAGATAYAYLLRAGQRAKQLFANEEAIAHFERAAKIADTETTLAGAVADVLVELADLHGLVGDYDDALALYRNARNRFPKDVRTWHGLAATLRKQGEFEAALATVDEAFATDALTSADVAPLWVESGRTLLLVGRPEQGVAVLEAGLKAVADRTDPTVGQLLIQLAYAEGSRGLLDAALDHGRRAETIFAEHGDVRGMASAYRVLGEILRLQKHLDEARTCLRRGVALAERIGNAEELGGSLTNLAGVEHDAGDHDGAVAHQQEAILEFERIGHASGTAQGYANLGWYLFAAGKQSEALEASENALALARRFGHVVSMADATDTVATIQLAAGDLAAAAVTAEDAARQYLDLGRRGQAMDALETAARAHERGGSEERAREARVQARNLDPT